MTSAPRVHELRGDDEGDPALRTEMEATDSGEVDVVLGTPAPAVAALEVTLRDLTGLVIRLCAVPAATLWSLDDGCLLLRSTAGSGEASAEGQRLLCAAVLTSREVVLVPDARRDGRFAGALARDAPDIRFLAGVPVLAADGSALGVLCVLDTEPRSMTQIQLEDLVLVAQQVGSRLTAPPAGAGLQVRPGTTAADSSRLRLLEAFLGHTDALVYLKDLQGRFVLTNAALETTLAVGGGLLGHTDHELFPAAEADVFRANDRRIAASGASEIVTEDLVHPDGTTHTYRSTKFPVRDEAGGVLGVGGVSVDVSELTAVRAAHEAAEARWQALVEQSPVAVAVIGSDGRFRYANPEAAGLYGAGTASAVVGRLAADFIPTGDEAFTAKFFHDVLAGGQPVRNRRWVLRRADGSHLIVEVDAARVMHDGAPAVQVELRDVSIEARAQQALAESEQRFRANFDDSPAAMALSDANGRWVQANAAFGRLFGADVTDLIGATGTDYVHPEDHPLLAAAERGQAVSPDGVHQMELRVVRPSGEQRWVWVSISPSPGPGGESYTLAVVQDVTARKAAERALQESEADLAAIAAIARCVQDDTDPRPVIVRAIQDLASAATVSMLEAVDDATLVVTSCVGMDAIGLPVPLTETSMTAHVWQTGEAVFLADAATSARVSPALLALDATVSALWQPVVVDGVVQAVLNVTWRRRIDSPSTRAVLAVRVIADETGLCLKAARLRRELELSATIDPLTGLLNRRAWDSNLLTLISANGGGTPLTLAIVDLDHFKDYNDVHGHTAGDRVLREFADNAHAVLRKGDIFARWGGEEFIVALPDTTAAHAARVLERVRTGIPAGETCSIGYASWDPDESITTCIMRADAALYDAKRAGRDRLAYR